MNKVKINLADAKAELRDAATGPDSQNWRYSPAIKALLNHHDELLVILGEAKVALEEKDQRIAEAEIKGVEKLAAAFKLWADESGGDYEADRHWYAASKEAFQFAEALRDEAESK